MNSQCIICQIPAKSITLNNYAMKKCPTCGLIWRQDFDLPSDYYQHKGMDLRPEKIQARILNSKDRIKKIKKYVNLNNLCDIGCGEGTLLKVLQDMGYQNMVGLEPAEQNAEFIKNNPDYAKLKIIQGNLENIKDVCQTHQIQTLTMFHLLEHLKNPLDSLKLIYHTLKPGSHLVIETPNINAYSFVKTNYDHQLIYAEHLFYFNQLNLKKILRQIGFKIVVMGKRDFNQANLSIKESLFRLGLTKKTDAESQSLDEVNHQLAQLSSPSNGSSIKILLKKIIRKTLNLLVVLSGRLDYIWLVAEK